MKGEYKFKRISITSFITVILFLTGIAYAAAVPMVPPFDDILP